MSNVRRARRVQSLASTNATLVQAGGSVARGFHVGNNGAAAAYFKVYDKATAPTVGTDVPVATFLVPIGGTVEVVLDHAFQLGLGFAITAGAADNNTAAVLADQVTGILFYE